jgi:hypothetical protein
MITFDAKIKKFDQQGEKTGWTYISIPAGIAGKIKPGTKKSFRVKGKIDEVKIEKVSILPMGNGDYIMALKKELRKKIGKTTGATVKVNLTEDKRELELLPELLICLRDEPAAYTAFMKLPPSHQRYYSKWISDAKTDQTRAKRIAKTVDAMLTNKSFGEALKTDIFP